MTAKPNFKTIFTNQPGEVESLIRLNLLDLLNDGYSNAVIDCALDNPLHVDALVKLLASNVLATKGVRVTRKEVGYIDTPIDTILSSIAILT